MQGPVEPAQISARARGLSDLFALRVRDAKLLATSLPLSYRGEEEGGQKGLMVVEELFWTAFSLCPSNV